MKRTFLVNADFISRKIQADGRRLAKIIQDSGENLSQQTLKSMAYNTTDRFTFRTICKASAVLKTSVANLIKAEECDRNKELDSQKLERILTTRGLKNKDLANRSCTDASSVSAYLLGKKTPSVELVYCYACALDIEPAQILRKTTKTEVSRQEPNKVEPIQETLFPTEPITKTNKIVEIIDCLIEALSDIRTELKCG